MFFIVNIISILLSSYLGCVAYRKSFVKSIKGKSKCESCGIELSSIELIPVIGYLLCKGKCRKCNKSIKWFYPVSEILFSFFITYIFIRANNWELLLINNDFNILFFIYNTLIATLLYYLSIYDLIHYEIDEIVINIVTVISTLYFLYGILFDNVGFTKLWIIIGIIFVFILINIVSNKMKKTLIGIGDARFLIMFLLIISIFEWISSLWVSSILGGIIALIVVLLNKKNWRKIKVPYIPIIYLGYMITIISQIEPYVQEYIDMLIFIIKN